MHMHLLCARRRLYGRRLGRRARRCANTLLAAGDQPFRKVKSVSVLRSALRKDWQLRLATGRALRITD